MHIEGPWLTTTGKRKGRQKFRNAEEARKARELEDSWKKLQKKWGVEAEAKQRNRAMAAPVWKPEKTIYRRETPYIPSCSPKDMSPCPRAPDKIYTGDKILGIGTLHKSNAVPVFSSDEAIEISKMRR